MKKPVATACAIAGLLSLCVGVLALFVPGLPTTPFLLLAVLASMHCSPRFVAWFNRTPICRCYLDDFLREHSMTRRNKIKTLAAGTVMIGISFFLIKPVWAKVLIIVVMAVKYYYFMFCVWTKIEDGHGMCAEKETDGNMDS